MRHDLLDVALDVETQVDTEGLALVTTSTIGRELMFVVSHTIHHNALIAQFARDRGRDNGATLRSGARHSCTRTSRMCTVTILPEALLAAARARTDDPLRWRLACNRDELTARAAALPPTITRIGPRLAIMPVDPDSGGTWIGVNDAGLACALLNVHRCSRVVPATLSRGTIIPPLLGYADVESVFMWTRQLQTDRYLPFRLLISDGYELIECWTAGVTLEHRRQRLHDAVMRT